MMKKEEKKANIIYKKVFVSENKPADVEQHEQYEYMGEGEHMHVEVCIDGGQVVIQLDRGRYICLSADTAMCFSDEIRIMAKDIEAYQLYVKN